MINPLDTRYLVFRRDSHGTKVLMTSGLPTQKWAAEYIKSVQDRQELEHRQTYEWKEYELGGLRDALDQEGILQ